MFDVYQHISKAFCVKIFSEQYYGRGGIYDGGITG
jgi:hypothetical protein